MRRVQQHQADSFSMCEANNHGPELLEAKALAPARLAGSLVAHVEVPTRRYTSQPLSWRHRSRSQQAQLAGQAADEAQCCRPASHCRP
jgi:hypothetical protein